MLVRAAAALAALAGLIVGVPALLVVLTATLPVDPSAWLPRSWGASDDGQLLLLLVLALGWIAWAVLVVSVVIEVIAAGRRVATPTLPGLAAPQRLASALVAAVLVALSSATASPAGAGAVVLPDSTDQTSVTAPVHRDGPGTPPDLGALVAAASAAGRDRTSPMPARPSALPAERESRPGPTVVTARNDTLWMLAEAHLGSGERYTEIVSLNQGVPQPDGRSLGSDGRLYPGWTLELPADARTDVDPTARHRVVPGDTLWDIAADELGDPLLHREIAEANLGDLQPDGRRLSDPDLILPGWVLELPLADGAAPEGRARGVDEPEDGGAKADEQRSSGDLAAPGRQDGRGPAHLDRAPLASPPIGSRPDAPGRDPAGPGSLLGVEPGHGRALEPAGQGLPVDRDSALDRPDDQAPPPIERAARGATPDRPQRDDQAVDEAGTTEDRRRHGHGDPGSQSPTPPGAGDAEGGDPLPVLDRASLRNPVQSAPPEAGTGGTRSDGAVPSTSLDPVRGLTALPHGGVVASLVLAGIGVELLRRRRQFQRLRRPGERMPTLSQLVGQLESASRSALQEPEPDLLERALTTLAAAARESAHPIPDVRLVRVGATTVTLQLGGTAAQPPAPFRPAGGHRWVVDAEQLPPAPPDQPRALPGLVTLGVSGSETILVNLGSVGTLSVAGAEPELANVLRGLAAELAFGPASTGTERTLCVSDPRIVEATEAGSLGVDADPVRVSAGLATALGQDPGPEADGATSPAQAWADLESSDPFQIVLSDQDLSVVVPPNRVCALITTSGAVHWSGATLVVEATGRALLLPEQEHLIPQSLGRASTDDLVHMLAAADVPGEGGAHGTGVEPDRELSVIDLRERPAAPPSGTRSTRQDPATVPGAGTESGGSAGVPRVLVLGEVVVEQAHGKAESTRIGRLAQTAAFILLHPGARPSELQGALWPGRRSNPQTCRQMISRTRTWLGRTPAGDPYLMPLASTDGRLRLRPEVGSDWADFQALAEVGLADPQDTEHLAAALALVRGRPFGSLAARELPWADLHINEMICAITDAAHALATRFEAVGQRAQAHEAALRGLLTESESEALELIVARTAP